MARLLHIVDDDEAIVRTVARIAVQDGWEVRPHGSADLFLAELPSLPFGCILSDIVMPGTSGTALIEILNRRCPDWPVVMMTGFAEVNAAVHSFRNGAVHFLQKPFKRAALLAVLAEAAQIGERRRAESERRQQSSAIASLTARESEILGALARGLQSKTIAFEFGISTRTVEMHRSNILAKLGARNTSQAVGMLQMAAAAA